MIKGFSLMEIFVTMTLSLFVLSIVIASVTGAGKHTSNLKSNQVVLESIFYTVDVLKSDLSKCGMRLQEASWYFNMELFSHTDNSLKVLYGMHAGTLAGESSKGENRVYLEDADCFSKGSGVIIYHLDSESFEMNKVKKVSGSYLELKENLKYDYPQEAHMIAVREVEYKHYEKQGILKRKLNGGYFQPMIERVTDFYIAYFPDVNSVLYRLEINNREQVRGYIFLGNMVGK